jgi:hypothetical protein
MTCEDLSFLDVPEPVRPSSFDLVYWVQTLRSTLLEHVPPGPERDDITARILAGMCLTARSEARLQ